MIADGVRETDLADYQRAVRTLLVHPLVTPSHPFRGALALIRRFSATLGADLDAVAGYRLEVGASCARLVRRVDRLDDTQAVRRRDRRPFDRRRYAYLCLVLAALGRSGTQVALTELADALKRRAAEVAGLGFDPDTYRHRLAFVDVVRHLLERGALSEVEASTVEWVRDPDAGEALYDVDRDVVHLLFVPPRVVQHVGSVRSLLTAGHAASRDTRRVATRQRLARLLLEHPVVEVDDLDDAERTYLTSQAASLGEELQRLTGGQIERRAEGLALIDATGSFSDRRFPAGGTPAQVALLLADAMSHEATAEDIPTATVPRAAEWVAALIERLDAARPTPATDLAGTDVGDPEPADGVEVIAGHTADGEPATSRPARADGPLFTDAWLEERVRSLTAAHGRTFAADLRDDPPALARTAVEVLVAFDLVRAVPGGVIARPALARYRDVAVEVAAPQGSLFDDAGAATDPTADPGMATDPDAETTTAETTTEVHR